MMQITKWLPASDYEFCQTVVERLKRNRRRKPWINERIRGGEHQICVVDNGLINKHDGTILYTDDNSIFFNARPEVKL